MTGAPAEILSLVALAICLGAAVVRPWGRSEAVFAVPAAVLVVAIGIVPWSAMNERLRALGPTVAFLALILLFGHLCAAAGVFDYLGVLAASGSAGRARRLLVLVVALAALVTVVLTLDATVVLLTPVVLRTAQRLRIAARPHLYACVELANAGSLLLPVSNLTNLLAFSASTLAFGRFAALMALPWLVVCLLSGVMLRAFFRTDLTGVPVPIGDVPVAPRYALVVLGVTVTGFVVTSSVDVAPAWAALGGVLLLGIPMLRRGSTTVPSMIAELNLGFVAFVLALGVVVEGVTRHGVQDALTHLVPHGQSLPTLLAIAGLAALLANLLNNLPATLLLLPLTAGSPAAVLAVLIGVNVGPNATYVGSLATLLWRRLLPAAERPRAAQFHAFGLLSVPVLLAAATCCLWLSVRAIGV